MSTDAKRRLTTVLVTGMSGAGKTSALKAFEDLNFEAIDTTCHYRYWKLWLPGDGEPTSGGLFRPLAVGVDIRTRDFDVETISGHHAALMDVGNGRASILFWIVTTRNCGSVMKLHVIVTARSGQACRGWHRP